VLDNEVNFEGDHTITGYTHRTEWVERTYYFVIEFDKPILTSEKLKPQDPREKAPRYILTFDMGNDTILNMKIAMSTTGIEGAKANLAAEVSGWNFNAVYQQAKNEWNKYLSRVQVEGTDDEKTSFYTSLYHLYIQPNNIADVDGRYVGPNRKITQSSTGKYYSTLSQWDTFRAAFPLYTILSPEIISNLVNSMIDYSEQQGHLPIWALMGQETYTMIGNHSVPMIVDAYLKGFTGFDAEKAYNEIKKSLTQTTHSKTNWDLYNQYGYYPYDLVRTESVSRTLECGFDDYCAALMAQKLGKTEDYNFFMKRAGYYKNLFDKETNSMRPKDSKGKWLTPFDPYELAHADSNIGGHYTEGNALQYTWHVLQDIPGLIEQMGGNEKAGEVLDYLFNTTQKTTGTLSDVTGLIDKGAYASSTTYVSGGAVRKAALEIRKQIIDHAALMLGISTTDGFKLENRQVIAPDGRTVSLQEVALSSLHQLDQHQIMATASHVSPVSPPPTAAQFVEMTVDTKTGKITIERLLMVVDCGRVINPITAAGQVEGGMSQAMGFALTEEMLFDQNGQLLNPDLKNITFPAPRKCPRQT